MIHRVAHVRTWLRALTVATTGVVGALAPKNPDFVKLADSFGIASFKATGTRLIAINRR